MVKITDDSFDANTFIKQYSENSIERDVTEILSKSNAVYTYSSINQLKFELNLRKNIVSAARELNRSQLAFRVFRESKCNPEFWERTHEGGFMLKSGVKPSDAIKDIYLHGSRYGTECSTAMIIVYYKALVNIFPEELFNLLFSEIYLMNWQHLDRNIGIVDYIKVEDYLAGDGRYFKNPDVDPLSPEWQGENVFDLGNSTYYGHGMGIASAEIIIEELNKKRISGSTVSAYLLDSAKRPNFKSLSDKYYNFTSGQTQPSVRLTAQR